MTPEERITAVVSQECERTHWVTAPYSTETPYVLLQVNGGRHLGFLNGQVGDKRQLFLQVEVWSTSVMEAKALSRAIEQRLRESAEFIARPQAEGQDGGDEELGRFSVQQDFGIFIARED